MKRRIGNVYFNTRSKNIVIIKEFNALIIRPNMYKNGMPDIVIEDHDWAKWALKNNKNWIRVKESN